MLRAAHGLISGRLGSTSRNLGSTSRNLGSTSGGVGVAEVFPRVRCAGGAVDRSACLRPVAVGLPPPHRAAPAPLPLTLTLGAWDGGRGRRSGRRDGAVERRCERRRVWAGTRRGPSTPSSRATSSTRSASEHSRARGGGAAAPVCGSRPRSCPTPRGRSAECARCWRRAESGSTCAARNHVTLATLSRSRRNLSRSSPPSHATPSHCCDREGGAAALARPGRGAAAADAARSAGPARAPRRPSPPASSEVWRDAVRPPERHYPARVGFELRRLRAIRRVPYVGWRPRRGLLRRWRDAAAAGWGGGSWSAGGWLGAASGAGEGGEEDNWHDCVFWVARAPPDPWGG